MSEKYTREAWIEKAKRQLLAAQMITESERTPKIEDQFSQWAESLAETYYDEDPDYCPVDAVNDELSNG